MRIFVTGASGMLGSEVAYRAVKEGHEVISALRKRDWGGPEIGEPCVVMSNEEMGRIICDMCPDLVIHCAAHTDVDDCEDRPFEAWESNVELTRIVAEAARMTSAWMTYISTDAVFGTDETAPSEETVLNPQSVYGRSKAAGEWVTADYCQKHHNILRVSSIYSGKYWARRHFAQSVVDKLQNGKEVIAWRQVTCPTLASSAAERVVEAATLFIPGKLHISDNAPASRGYFAQCIASRFNIKDPKIKEIEMPTAGVAPRASNQVMNIAKSIWVLKSQPLTLDQAIDRFYKEMKI